MIPTISREQSRALDRRAADTYGMASVQLMENAGRGVADRLCRLGIDGPVVLCCGRGNNGGDGFVVARHLDLRGFEVGVLVFDDPTKLAGDAALNFHILRAARVAIREIDPSELDTQLSAADWIVDALLGTGAQGDPRPPYDAIIERINAQSVPVMAVDLPSGLDCDTGVAAHPTVKATHTCTFVAHKPGLLAPAAQAFTGQIHVVDIGVPRALVEETLGNG